MLSLSLLLFFGCIFVVIWTECELLYRSIVCAAERSVLLRKIMITQNVFYGRTIFKWLWVFKYSNSNVKFSCWKSVISIQQQSRPTIGINAALCPREWHCDKMQIHIDSVLFLVILLLFQFSVGWVNFCWFFLSPMAVSVSAIRNIHGNGLSCHTGVERSQNNQQSA